MHTLGCEGLYSQTPRCTIPHKRRYRRVCHRAWRERSACRALRVRSLCSGSGSLIALSGVICDALLIPPPHLVGAPLAVRVDEVGVSVVEGVDGKAALELKLGVAPKETEEDFGNMIAGDEGRVLRQHL